MFLNFEIVYIMDFQLLANVFITNQVGRINTSHWLHTVHYSEAEPAKSLFSVVRLLFVSTRNVTLSVCEQLLLCDFNGHQSQSDLFINQQRLQK